MLEVEEVRLEGLKLIKPKVFPDDRGFFLESYSQRFMQEHGICETFCQDNHSFSYKGTVRGMHFQKSPGQAKIMRVAVGRIFEVAVDIRPQSPTFGQWYGVYLDGERHHQLYLPVGFANGFCVMSDYAHVMYKVSAHYDPETEAGFRWDDPDVGIEWPVGAPIVSERDQTNPFLRELKL